MIPLTFNAAISNRFASVACLQFGVIVFSDAAGSATHHSFLCTTHPKNSMPSYTDKDSSVACYKNNYDYAAY